MVRAWMIAAAILCMAAPAAAGTDATPPGNPCTKNNGNPCNGNNGNLGRQGNANHEKTTVDKKPPAINLPMPPVSGRGAFVDQVGDGNLVDVMQSAPNAFATVDQRGNGNEADVNQSGSGTAYASLRQTGDGNFARAEQGGAGQNMLQLAQTGQGNWAWSSQSASGPTHNGALLLQVGDRNDMTLTQNGSDNRAVLTQTGSDNGMSATQIGEGNRLIWEQQGNALSDLQITQTGGWLKGGQLMVTQTNQGPGN